MIEVKNLHKSFGEAHILKGISATFHQGQTNLIIGQSGSGKSVFLKCLLGLYSYEQGSIEYNGEIFADLSEDKKRDMRAKIGMVFQGSALFDSLTIEENVMFPLRMFTKLKKDEMRDRANVVLKRVNLEGAHKKMPSEASGGMQKRVAIARAIVNNPKYLFCDEPNSGLDPKTAIVIDNLIHEITEEYQITTVINTHDMNSVMEIGDHIMFLKDGLKAWEGTKDTIFRTDNEVVTDFVYSSNLFKKVREAIIKENK
ncbi:ABC transporter ATP-binding protein [Lacinutrix algicola]|uniref:ABC transporter ATP-binding protein n=1 Tax=Lacinutrix algicola TaxID=342954 RepID=UPI0006E14A02|nr:ABC transporter ATP-binding protein [Lacinutrix algicola]